MYTSERLVVSVVLSFSQMVFFFRRCDMRSLGTPWSASWSWGLRNGYIKAGDLGGNQGIGHQVA